jgi:hypothetical protein
MEPERRTAAEGLLAWVERWSPADAESWTRWRRTLSSQQRSEALFPLQSLLSGLVAFRQLENHPLATSMVDFRPHLLAVHAGFDWALDLIDELGGSPPDGDSEPGSSLRNLERSITDARHVSGRLAELQTVDAAAFQSSCDLFLRDLSRNAFFRPPEPLEFANVSELVEPSGFGSSLDGWQSEAAKTTTVIAFLTLLRSHRCLRIADRQIGDRDGLLRAQILVAGARRELRALTQFLLVQGVESFAQELEARLLEVDAGELATARPDIGEASKELQTLRETVEGIAVEIHSKVRSLLEEPLPELSAPGIVVSSERLRNGVRELRTALKEAARRLRCMTEIERHPDRVTPKSERVRADLTQDIWAFRLILRAFLAKAAVSRPGSEGWSHPERPEFIGEFVRHFRVFGPRLAKGTVYAERGALTRAVSALSGREELDAARFDAAIHACDRFVEHLETKLDEASPAPRVPFDKRQAAVELRGYLAAAKERSLSDQAAAGAFGVFDPTRLNAG